MKKSLIIHPEELSTKWIDKISELGCDCIGIHPVGGAHSKASLEKLIDMSDNDEYKRLIDYAIEKGLNIEYEMHAARFLLPESYFETNPEYFRMNKEGIRTSDYNFCVSNDNALEIICQNSLKLAKNLYKSSNKFYFWLDDSKDAFCHCEKCKNIKPCDQQMIVLNAMIKYIRQQIPNAKMAYLAYYETLDLPTVKPEDGIFVEFAPYERDFSLPAQNMKDEHIIILKKLIGFLGTKDSKILEYWYDNSLFSDYKKPPKELKANNELIHSDFEFYKSFGVEFVASFACYLGDDYLELYDEPDLSAFELL